jgi:hypothetical protein
MFIRLNFKYAALELGQAAISCLYQTFSPPRLIPSVPIYRRYSFLKKIQKYKTPAKFGERFVDIFHKQIWSGERWGREFPYFPPLSTLKPRKINYLTRALILVRKLYLLYIGIEGVSHYNVINKNWCTMASELIG